MNMRNVLSLRLFALGLLCVAAGGSALGQGGMPGVFLEYGPAPRSLAMGRAFTAIADDAQAAYFNPAGLFQLNAQEVLLAHSQLYGARMEYLGYALPTRKLGTFSLTLLNFGSEGIPSRDQYNNYSEDYVFAENAYMASYAYNPWNFLGLGANLKLVTKNLALYSDVGVGADAGLLLRFSPAISLGFTLQNALQPSLRLITLEERYPRVLRGGVALRLLDDRVVVGADLVANDFLRSERRTLVPHGGVEFEVVPGVLFQRTGFDPNEITLGLGVHKNWGKMGLGVDYAFLLHHQSSYRMNPTHKLGLFVTFAGFRVWIDAQPSKFSPTPEDQQNVLWMDVRLLTRRATKRWQVLIKNSFGEVVRSYSGWENPPLRMTWDGLDDAGRLVTDGRYYYSIVVVDTRNTSLDYSGFLTEVKTRGPQGKIEIRPGQE